MAVAVAAKAAITVLQAMTSKEGRGGLKALGTVLVTTITLVALLLCMIVYVLTSPMEFEGDLGMFQSVFSSLLPGAGAGGGMGGEGGLTDQEIALLTADIQDPNRKAVVENALSLVGRVSYFWGGKSGPGWNDAWGTPTLVTAPGSSTSGTYQPYGMDCTGFVHWAFWTALGTDSLRPAASDSLWYGSVAIREDELLPGDIVYLHPPSGVNHAGIYVGERDGKHLYVHCAFSGGVVLNSYSGFQYFRRPPIYDDLKGVAA